MNKFLLFAGGLVALMVLIVNLGPMILLGLSVWLLYLVFKQFVKSDSTAGKIGWVVVGLIVASMALSNIYALIGFAAGYVLYLIAKKWKKSPDYDGSFSGGGDDPFTNFERQWADLSR
ncbi:hypothetical protein JNUCC1_00648 [Lentibacillus sp. JNUCC-1]|uniref:lmo0954 family membrane protein n=1 Tax=Lentibacillus sp. JNUCC-1 TaxID=2654513 RepID=UPI0012E7A428|nr:flagellar basal body rod protein [Lentibacillus sp. JNUCC-1]MUV36844.1 hypothetical protein [Lentibacillus sp. JNUCC-1]